MLKVKHTALATAFAAAFAMSLPGAALAQKKPEIKLVIAHGLAPLVSITRTLDTAAKRLEEYSEGRIAVDVKGQKKLCSEHKCVEQALLGQVDIVTSSSGNMGNFGNTFDINFLPYIFKDDESADKLLNGWYGEHLKKQAAKNIGLHVLSTTVTMGFRNLDNSVREVRVPKDLKGIKIRVTKSPVEFVLIKEWGAVPVPYDWGQLYEGLQSGVVQGMYIPDAFVAARKFQEVVPYITHTGGGLVTHVTSMKKERYDALPDWAKKIVDRVFEEARKEHLAVDRVAREELTKTLAPKATIYKPTPEEFKLWFAAAPKAWLKLKGRFDPKIARRMLEEQGLTDLLKLMEKAGAI